jgi:3-deoxy-manno-octulosonate cytidylyltransferase (CMP-KDO synthetase)
MALFHRVVIATDSSEVANVAHAFGAEVELTRPEHLSGTDRVAEVAARAEYAGFPVIVNLQGDEPFVSPAAVQAALALVRDGSWGVGTVAAPLVSVAEWRDPATVKVVRGAGGAALLFTRSPVPHVRGREPTPQQIRREPFLRHLGVYAYRREALLRWVALPPSRLEELEKLEQLRPLEAGIRIGVARTQAPEHGGIDTPEDVARAEHILRDDPHTFRLNGP